MKPILNRKVRVITTAFTVIIIMFTYALTKSPTLKALSLVMFTLFMLYRAFRHEIKDYIKGTDFKIKIFLVKTELKKSLRNFLNTVSFFLLILKKKPTLKEEKFIKKNKKKIKRNLKQSFKEVLMIIIVMYGLMFIGMFFKFLDITAPKNSPSDGIIHHLFNL